MANITSKPTRHMSPFISLVPGENPVDNSMNIHPSKGFYNEGGYPKVELGGIEFQCNFDTAGTVYLEGLEKEFHGIPQRFAITYNETEEALVGSLQFSFLAIEGSIDKTNWASLASGSMTPIGGLKSLTARQNVYQLEEVKEEIGTLRAMGRWPYLRLKMTYSMGDNSENGFKIVLLEGDA